MSRYCPSCGTKQEKFEGSCNTCGWHTGMEIPGDKRFCATCGTSRPKDESFCPKCTSKYKMTKCYCPACGSLREGYEMPCTECEWKVGTKVTGDKLFCTTCGTLKIPGENLCPKCSRPLPRWLTVPGYLILSFFLLILPVGILLNIWSVIHNSFGRVVAVVATLFILKIFYIYSKMSLINALLALKKKPTKY